MPRHVLLARLRPCGTLCRIEELLSGFQGGRCHDDFVTSWPWLRHTFRVKPNLIGGYWWYTGIPTPLKNDGVRQIGSSSQLLGKIIHSCFKPPTSNLFLKGWSKIWGKKHCTRSPCVLLMRNRWTEPSYVLDQHGKVAIQTRLIQHGNRNPSQFQQIVSGWNPFTLRHQIQ